MREAVAGTEVTGLAVCPSWLICKMGTAGCGD